MAAHLKERSAIGAIHIISHGEAGKVQLGNSWLSSGNLAEHSASPSAISQAVVSNGDILLYGCEVGANEEGREFIDALARATGADITAY